MMINILLNSSTAPTSTLLRSPISNTHIKSPIGCSHPRGPLAPLCRYQGSAQRPIFHHDMAQYSQLLKRSKPGRWHALDNLRHRDPSYIKALITRRIDLVAEIGSNTVVMPHIQAARLPRIRRLLSAIRQESLDKRSRHPHGATQAEPKPCNRLQISAVLRAA